MTTRPDHTDSPALPFVPVSAFLHPVLSTTEYRVRTNRRRPRPPLAMSICAAMCSALALFISTEPGQALVVEMVPALTGGGGGWTS